MKKLFTFMFLLLGVCSVITSCESRSPESKDISVYSIELNRTKLDLFEGSEFILTATVVPDNASDKTVVWETRNDQIASVSETGLVKGVGVGKTMITASADGGRIRTTCTIMVCKEEKLVLNENVVDLFLGDEFILLPKEFPESITNYFVTWKSSNPSVALVSKDGKIAGFSQGKSTITASVCDGAFEASCEVNVKVGDTPEAAINVYNAGIAYLADYKCLAVWKNGIIQYIVPDSSYFVSLLGISVYADDIYLAGHCGEDSVLKVTKNGELIHEYEGFRVMNALLYEGDLYFLDYGAVFKSTVFKNGKILLEPPKSDNNHTCVVSSIFIENGVVYSAGNEAWWETGKTGVNTLVWKNDELLYVVDGLHLNVSDMAVENGEVYVTGYLRNDENGHQKCIVLKNGKEQFVFNSKENPEIEIPLICVYNGDVYVAYVEKGSKNSLVIWKNGQELYRFDDYILNYSIKVVKGDVYVSAGSFYNGSKVWKNGKVMYEFEKEKFNVSVMCVE